MPLPKALAADGAAAGTGAASTPVSAAPRDGTAGAAGAGRAVGWEAAAGMERPDGDRGSVGVAVKGASLPEHGSVAARRRERS
jgi:hypothetical protein